MEGVAQKTERLLGSGRRVAIKASEMRSAAASNQRTNFNESMRLAPQGPQSDQHEARSD